MDQTGVAETRCFRKEELQSSGQGDGVDYILSVFLPMLRWRFLTSWQISIATGYDLDYVRCELVRDLIAARLIKRVKIKKKSFGSGRAPYAFRPTRDAYEQVLDALAHIDDCADPVRAVGPFPDRFRQLLWHDKFPHLLATQNSLVAAEVANHRQPLAARLVDIIGEWMPHNGHRFPTYDYDSQDRRFRPDGVLIMAAGKQMWADLVEQDMGTETIASDKPARFLKTLEGKCHVYADYYRGGRITRRFGVTSPNFRVLFIAPDKGRADAILDRIRWDQIPEIRLKSDHDEEEEVVSPSEVFHVAAAPDIDRDFFGPHWRVPGISGKTPLIQRAAPS